MLEDLDHLLRWWNSCKKSYEKIIRKKSASPSKWKFQRCRSIIPNAILCWKNWHQSSWKTHVIAQSNRGFFKQHYKVRHNKEDMLSFENDILRVLNDVPLQYMLDSVQPLIFEVVVNIFLHACLSDKIQSFARN